MKLHVLADLHLEFGTVGIPATDADVVVCAGDIHTGTRGLEWITSQFPVKQVIYVLGNHEFYQHGLPSLTERLRRETEGTQVHLLENQAVELSGYWFLGCTLWTDFELRGNGQMAMLFAQDRMNDFRIVRCSTANRPLRPDDARRLHRDSVAWLKREFALHNPNRTIVVTHHAPSARSELRAYANSPLTPSFASNLDALVAESGVPLWIHGHTHHDVDYHFGYSHPRQPTRVSVRKLPWLRPRAGGGTLERDWGAKDMKSKTSAREERRSAGRRPKPSQHGQDHKLPALCRTVRAAEGRELPDEKWLLEMCRLVRRVSRQLDELEMIFRAIEVLENIHAARRWFNGVVPALGKRPIDLCQTARGRRAVLRELGRIEHGVHS